MEAKKFIINNENVEYYAEKISKWIKEQVHNAGANGVVLGMSGGVDCSTVARLCQKANINIHLVLMPYGENMHNSKSYEHAMELINKYNFEYHIFDIKKAVDDLIINSDETNSEKIKLAVANIKPRIRMTYLYEYAGINNLLVIGTGNLSERTVGYFTKWGDGANDLNPIANLTKKEVYILAKYLQLPDSIINKEPSADLWKGQTDETELGIKYEQIDRYILTGTSGDNKIDNIIRDKNKKNMHKLNSIPIFEG